MSISASAASSGSYLQQILAAALQSSGISASTGTQSSAQSDTSQLSPFAQLASTLQKLQQSDPATYKQVTGELASSLQSAAAASQSQGNTRASSQLTQLAADFSGASKTGQLPDLQDLAQALGQSVGHGHHHGSTQESSTSDLFTEILNTLNAAAARSASDQTTTSSAGTSSAGTS